MKDIATAVLVWMGSHQTFVTLAVMIPAVVWYYRCHLKRKGDCPPHLWLMFTFNVVGIVTGTYVLGSSLVSSLVKEAAGNDQNTLWTGIGGLGIVLFTMNNVRLEMRTLFQQDDVSPEAIKPGPVDRRQDEVRSRQ